MSVMRESTPELWHSTEYDSWLREVAHAPAHSVRLSTAPRAGERLASGRFELLRQIGRGGMGRVFEAYDHRHCARVALKTLREGSSDGPRQMKREFRAIRGIAHPNLVRLLELFGEAEPWFFTMELVPGDDFLRHVRPDGQVDEARLRHALSQLVHAVRALHAAGKVHRDLKPSNVLVTAEQRLVVLDFGLMTNQAGEGLQTLDTNLHLGTPAYLAPEQAQGQRATPASDWYAVGTMLYEALAGQLPYSGNAAQVLAAKHDARPIAALELPPALADLGALSMAYLCPDPDERMHAARAAELPARTSPAPERTGRDGGTVIAPRDAELQALQLALDAVRQGALGIALIHGAPGSGKSALLRALGKRAATQCAMVLTGTCSDREALPYRGLDNILEGLADALRRLPKQEGAALLPRHLRELIEEFPALARLESLPGAVMRPPQSSTARQRRARASAALRELLQRVCDRYPLVLVIDDAHFFDVQSASLLRDLLSADDAPALLLVAAMADADAPGARALCQALLAMPVSEQRRLCHEFVLPPPGHCASTPR